MRVRASNARENAYWQGIADALDAAATPGKIQVWAGDVPAAGGSLNGTNVKVLEFVLQKPCGSVADGKLTFNAVGYATVLSGEAHAFARAVDGDGVFVIDMDTGLAGDDVAVKLPAATLTVGSLVIPTALYLKSPD